MATETTNKNVIVDRDYSDNFSVKETAMNTLGQKYFGDVELSGLNVGLLGFTLEQIANITEDSFNTASVMVNELFPNRAIIPESIYSHAAIFQMDNSFATPAVCTFAMLLEESEFLKYATSSSNDSEFPKHYFIDKKTIFNVEDIPFTLDYDIKISCVKIDNENGSIYKYSAKYSIDTEKVIDEITGTSEDIEMINSLSDEGSNPFLKIRRIITNSSNPLLMILFNARQVTRTTKYTTITNNTRVNYPILEFNFNGKLAGFDIYYKNPGNSSFLPMEKKVFYSIPIKKPFCYYRLKNANTLLITFTSRDGYFKPDFNCEIKIDIYTTLGKNGNFTAYEGNNIDVQRFSDVYKYNGNMIYAVRPISDSKNGNDSINLEALQALTVEAYSTATELSTEDDILRYFYDYKYRYGTEMLVFKRRDDIFERLFSSFLVLKNDNYIYPTNTLRLSINKNQFDEYNSNTNISTLSPGHIFVYKEDRSDVVEIIRNVNAWDLEYNPKLYVVNGPDNIKGTYVPFLDGNITKYRRYYSDDYDGQYDIKTSLPINNTEYKFVYTNPFLIYVSENDNIVGLYQTAIHDDNVIGYVESDIETNQYNTYISSKITVDRNNDKFKRYRFSVELTPSSSAIKQDSDDVLGGTTSSNEYIQYYFGVAENEKYFTDILEYKDVIDENTGNIVSKLVPSEKTLDSITENEVRVFIIFKNRENIDEKVAYMELLPTEYNSDDKSIVKFENFLYVNDQITSIEEVTVDNNYDADNIPIIFGNETAYKLCSVHSLKPNKINVDLDIIDVEAQVLIYHKTTEQATYISDVIDNTAEFIKVTEYKTIDKINLIKPMNMMRSTLSFEDIVDLSNIRYGLSLIPFVRSDIVKDEEAFNIFTDRLTKSYIYMENSMSRLRNNTHIDIKFYNTYGKSNNYIIKGLIKEVLYYIVENNQMTNKYYDNQGYYYDESGLIDEANNITAEELSNKILHEEVIPYETGNYVDNEEIIDKVNVTIKFDITFKNGTDLIDAEDKVSTYIRQYIESINDEGTNELYISNLIKNIENNFSEVHHLKFRGINNYDTSYQTIAVKKYDLTTLTKEERRNYVPELLVIEEGINVGVIISSSTTLSI